MADNRSYSDRDSHSDHRRKDDNTNWWPLLLIPLAFFVGWGAKGAVDSNNSSQNQIQRGVGGGPNQTMTPTSTATPAPSQTMTPTPSPSLSPGPGTTGP